MPRPPPPGPSWKRLRIALGGPFCPPWSCQGQVIGFAVGPDPDELRGRAILVTAPSDGRPAHALYQGEGTARRRRCNGEHATAAIRRGGRTKDVGFSRGEGMCPPPSDLRPASGDKQSDTTVMPGGANARRTWVVGLDPPLGAKPLGGSSWKCVIVDHVGSPGSTPFTPPNSYTHKWGPLGP